jgi:hypothetical protein
MPNWCSNTLTLRHKDPAMIQRARDAFVRGEFLQEFIPCPEELRNTTAQFGGNDQEKANIEKYGYASWYDWQIAHWGTKWDVGGDGCDALTTANEFNASFESAWAPPVNAYEKLMDMGFEIEAMYYEPGMCFAGHWDNGHDDYYEYGNMSAEEIANTLPGELDEEFGISESVAEWESEQEEEEE